MAQCGIKLIKVGSKNVQFNKIVEALEVSKGIANIDEAIIKGYTKLQDSVSLKEWTNWFTRLHDVSKGAEITEEDLVGYEAGGRVRKLKNLLNFEGLIETVQGEKHYSLLPETVQTINMLKKRLLTRGEHLSEGQIDQLIDSLESTIFVSKLNSNAHKLRDQARKNIKSKLGAAKDIFPLVKKFLSLDFQQVPFEQREEYMKVLASLGARTANLNLKEVKENVELMKDVLQLASKAREASGVKEDDPVEKEIRIYKILNTDIKTSELEDKSEKELVDRLKEMTKRDLGELDNRQLQHLIDGITNINNGFLTYNTNRIIEDIEANRAYAPLVNIVKNIAGVNISNLLQKLSTKGLAQFGGSSATFKNLSARAKTAVDQVFGNKGTEIFDSIFRPLSVAEQRYERDGRIIDEKMDVAESRLFKNKIGNARIKSLFKIKILEKAREGESNEDTYSAMDYVNAAKEEAGPGKQYTKEDVKIFDELIQEFSDGENFIIETLESSLDEAELAAHNAIQELYEGNSDKAAFTSGVIRGERIDLLANYSHSNVIGSKSDENIAASSLQKKMLSTAKSSTLTERIKKSEQPQAPLISFNPVADARRATKLTLLDYHMTPAIRHAKKVTQRLEKAVKEQGGSELAQEGAAALVKSVDEQISRELSRSFERYDPGTNVWRALQRNAYLVALASPIRAGRELASNVAFIAFVRPLSFIKGVKSKIVRNPALASELLGILGSTQIGKMYSRGYTTRFVESTFAQAGEKKSRINALTPTQQRVAEVRESMIGKNLTKGGQALNALGTNILSAPDKVMNIPLYWGEFADQFKKETGLELTEEMIQKFVSDENFRNKHKEALQNSVKQADKISVLAAGTTSGFAGIDKIKQDPTGSQAKNAMRYMGYYLMTFALWEADTWRQGWASAVGKGNYTQLEGARMMAGATARIGVYGQTVSLTLTSILQSLALIEDDDEEEEEGSITESVFKSILESILTLGGMGTMSSYHRILPSFAIEAFNEEYLEKLRNGEAYNAWRHSLVFNTLSKDDFGYGKFGSLLLKLSGPFKPLLKDIKKVHEGISYLKNAKTEEQVDLAIQILATRFGLITTGYFGINPFYRDLTKWHDSAYRGAKKEIKSNSKRDRGSRKERTERKER